MPLPSLVQDTISETENGLLSNILRYISRSGWATRSLLTGDFEGAARNAGQLLLDTPTAGFLDRRLSLANLFSDTGDITKPSQRPEGSDVLYRLGGDHPSTRGFGERMAIDVAGGLLDPLTFLSGPLRSVFGKTIASLPRARQGALLADALRQTPEGVKALAGAGDEVLGFLKNRKKTFTDMALPPSVVSPASVSDDVVRAGSVEMREAAGPTILSRAPTERPTRLARRLTSGEELSPRYRARLDQLVEGMSAERVVGRSLGQSPEFTQAVKNLREVEDVFNNPASMAEAAPRYRAAIAAKDVAWAKQVDDLDEGLGRLRESGLLGAGRGLRFAGVELPSAWVNTGRFATLPGLARETLLQSDRTKPLVEIMDTKTEEAWDWLVGSFVDRKLSGKAPEALKFRAREIEAREVAGARRVDRVAQEIMGGLDEAGQVRFGKTLARYEDEYNKALHVAQAPNVLADGTPGPNLPLPDPDEFMARFVGEVEQIPGMRPDTVKRWVSEMDQVKRDSIKAGWWKDLTKTVPEGMTKAQWEKVASSSLYLPHQLSATFGTLLGDSFKNKDLLDDVRNVFTERRGYRTAEDFSRALEAVALKYGVRVEGLTDLQDFNAVSLFRKRLLSHNRSMARAELIGAARNLGMVPGDPLSEYLKVQLSPVSRDSIAFMPARKVAEFLGGGRFSVEVTNNPRLEAWVKNTDKNALIPRTIRRESNGRVFADIHWPGLNTFWRAPLTVAVPSYHFRNIASAVAVGGFDKDVGYAAGGRAVKGMVYSALRSPLVKRFADIGLQPNEIADAVNLLHHDPVVRGRALAALKESGKTVGKHSWDEVSRILDGAIPEFQNMADIDRAIGRIDVWGRELNHGWDEILEGKAGNRFVSSIRKFVQMGSDLSNATEQHFRVSAMIDMLRKGVDPVDATRRMKRIMVDYAPNSQVERFVRDFAMFLRYTLGSTQWVKSIASEPRLVALAGRAQASAKNSMAEEGGVVPSRATDTLALPLPWRDLEGNAQWLVSLGLPHEVALKTLGLVTPSGFRQQVLGGLTPAVRLPLEYATGKSFFFNEDVSGYRRAPAWAPDALTTEINLPDGSTRREWSGDLNAVLGAMPFARVESMIESMLNDQKPAWATLTNFVTGARVISSDQERELAKRLAEFLKDEASKGTVGEKAIWFSRLSKEDMPAEVVAALKAVQNQATQRRKRRALAGM